MSKILKLPNGIPSHDTINRGFSLIKPGKFEQLVLGQIKTSEKSNEITAIPELLNILDIEECIITIDAMGTQKKMAETIIDKQADYILAVKKSFSYPTLSKSIVVRYSISWKLQYFLISLKLLLARISLLNFA